MSSQSSRLLVGPAIRRPLDPQQNARNMEAVLKVTDAAGRGINVLKCTGLSWERLTDEKCRLVCRGQLITRNQQLLKSISRLDTSFTWSLASTAGPRGKWIAKLQAVPDFSRD